MPFAAVLKQQLATSAGVGLGAIVLDIYPGSVVCECKVLLPPGDDGLALLAAVDNGTISDAIVADVRGDEVIALSLDYILEGGVFSAQVTGPPTNDVASEDELNIFAKEEEAYQQQLANENNNEDEGIEAWVWGAVGGGVVAIALGVVLVSRMSRSGSAEPRVNMVPVGNRASEMHGLSASEAIDVDGLFPGSMPDAVVNPLMMATGDHGRPAAESVVWEDQETFW